ncbi:hypothetical protein DV515_00007262 [Chloebia gouldiae]|uniref:Uncharacterized protein n=1 Tax=Chloebia gouldiae TaxID=44316 RepID=A0A3L8SIV4_CHLGU|nr:hypothetical protein DV515_00007262 [Chloebia gouldiae]
MSRPRPAFYSALNLPKSSFVDVLQGQFGDDEVTCYLRHIVDSSIVLLFTICDFLPLHAKVLTACDASVCPLTHHQGICRGRISRVCQYSRSEGVGFDAVRINSSMSSQG